jgi:hypothetical protein
MTQYLKLYGERLVELGYTVLPIKPGSKRPDIKDWPRHATTAANVVAWYSNGRAQHGVGINARNTPAIDVDVLDPEVAQAMSDAIDQVFPGVALMTRTGLAPKFLIPFRSDEPFRKLVSQTYTDGKRDHKVEILGDGQQFVAYAVHPDTGRPYVWFDGVSAEGIREVRRDELPALTRDDAQRVIDAFEVLASKKVLKGDWITKAQISVMEENQRVSDDPFAAHAAPVGKAAHEVEALLARHPNNEADYDHWFKVLAAVHHELGDAGEDIAHAWSTESHKHTDEKFELTWNSLGSYTGRQVTLRSLLKEDKAVAPPVGDFVQAAQFASAQRVEWHIKHVLPKKGLIVIYGEPGSSKSFFALDMIAHIARGLPWRGHRTRQANVAYIAAEGVAGFGNRLAAYAKHQDIALSELPVFVRGGALMLNESAIGISESVNKIGGVGVIVIDTLAAVTPGDNENTSEDMGEAIKSANLIMEATGASVILIHHSNNQGGLRGWSGLRGAVDNQIRIERKEGLRTAHIEKQKEGEDGRAYGYRLQVVDLYTDEDGDAVTSCVVVEDENVAPNTRNVKKERKPRSGDFETSDNYIKARDFLAIIQHAMGLDPEASMTEDEIVEAIQADPKANEMGQDDYPPKRYITPTLRTLVQKGKIYREGRDIKLCA